MEDKEELTSDLPSMEAMLKAICEKEGITEEEAKERVKECYERDMLITVEVAAYYYCVGKGIKDDDIDKYETAPVLVERMRLKIRSKFITTLKEYVRELWDMRKAANEYFEEVIALLLDIFKVNAEKGFTTPQILALVEVIAKATEFTLSSDDVEQCLDILDKAGIQWMPVAQDSC